jgi:hypothetical protein
MIKTHKLLVVAGTAFAVTVGSSLAFADESSNSTNSSETKMDTEPGSKGKTSDRTPGDPAPARTPNASSSGNTGTEAGQTHEGTSDRTPSNDDKSMEK